MPAAAVIRHVAFEGAGSFRAALAARGFDVLDLSAPTDDLSPAAEADLLIVLGGPISANDTGDYPFLDTEIALLRDRLAADRPTLGICLGAQIMARALDAPVYPAREKEIGWAPLHLTPAGVDLLAHLHKVPVLHWHGETFDLPPGARLLASTAPVPNQAFTVGRRGLGLQFHPEVTATDLEAWFVGHTREIAATPGLDVASLRADTAECAPALEAAGPRFFANWLDRVMA